MKLPDCAEAGTKARSAASGKKGRLCITNLITTDSLNTETDQMFREVSSQQSVPIAKPRPEKPALCPTGKNLSAGLSS
jgi:hypothetical protein